MNLTEADIERLTNELRERYGRWPTEDEINFYLSGHDN